VRAGIHSPTSPVPANLIAFISLIALLNIILDSLSDKTVAVVTFALCGFANFGSFAILLGGLAQIAPKRRGSVARLGVRAVLAGTLANLLNAAVAGMF
jgi:CNT family concentrative nucleoside transporter